MPANRMREVLLRAVSRRSSSRKQRKGDGRLRIRQQHVRTTHQEEHAPATTTTDPHEPGRRTARYDCSRRTGRRFTDGIKRVRGRTRREPVLDEGVERPHGLVAQQAPRSECELTATERQRARERGRSTSACVVAARPAERVGARAPSHARSAALAGAERTPKRRGAKVATSGRASRNALGDRCRVHGDGTERGT